jgi:hypothetical protein
MDTRVHLFKNQIADLDLLTRLNGSVAFCLRYGVNVDTGRGDDAHFVFGGANRPHTIMPRGFRSNGRFSIDSS